MDPKIALTIHNHGKVEIFDGVNRNILLPLSTPQKKQQVMQTTLTSTKAKALNLL